MMKPAQPRRPRCGRSPAGVKPGHRPGVVPAVDTPTWVGAGEGATLLSWKPAFSKGVGKIPFGASQAHFQRGPGGQPGRGGWESGFKERRMEEAGTEAEVALDLARGGGGGRFLSANHS